MPQSCSVPEALVLLGMVDRVELVWPVLLGLLRQMTLRTIIGTGCEQVSRRVLFLA